jgi:hypothetical protein
VLSKKREREAFCRAAFKKKASLVLLTQKHPHLVSFGCIDS